MMTTLQTGICELAAAAGCLTVSWQIESCSLLEPSALAAALWFILMGTGISLILWGIFNLVAYVLGFERLY